MLAIKMRELVEAHEELRAVRVGTGVGHRHDTGASVLMLEVFIGELGSVDGLATGAVEVREVTALSHEAGNDTVENGLLEVQALAASLGYTLLASAESSEVLSSLGSVTEQVHLNSRLIASLGLSLELLLGPFLGS